MFDLVTVKHTVECQVGFQIPMRMYNKSDKRGVYPHADNVSKG